MLDKYLLLWLWQTKKRSSCKIVVLSFDYFKI